MVFVLSMFSLYAKRVQLPSGFDAIYNIIRPNPLYVPRDYEFPSEFTDAVLYDDLRRRDIVVGSLDDDIALLQRIKQIDSETNCQIETLYLIVADKCNLKCKYCFVEEYAERNKAIMSSDVMRKSLELFRSSLISQRRTSGKIVFYGGEPLIAYKIIKEAILICKSWGYNIQYEIVTNGVLVDNSIATFFRDNGIRLSISLDGPERINDANRCFRDDTNKSGTYIKAMKSLKILLAHNVLTGISLTLTELTIHNNKGIIEWLSNIGTPYVAFNLLHDRNSKSTENYRSFASFCIEACDRLSLHDNRILRRKDCFENSDFIFCDCSALGINQIAIDPDGNIFVCHCLREADEIVGNVASVYSFHDLLGRLKSSRWLNAAPLYRQKCRSCMALSICGGGCPANAEVFPEDIAFCSFAEHVMLYLLQRRLDNAHSESKWM